MAGTLMRPRPPINPRRMPQRHHMSQRQQHRQQQQLHPQQQQQRNMRPQRRNMRRRRPPNQKIISNILPRSHVTARPEKSIKSVAHVIQPVTTENQLAKTTLICVMPAAFAEETTGSETQMGDASKKNFVLQRLAIKFLYPMAQLNDFEYRQNRI
jgi:hypothetical protein